MADEQLTPEQQAAAQQAEAAAAEKAAADKAAAEAEANKTPEQKSAEKEATDKAAADAEVAKGKPHKDRFGKRIAELVRDRNMLRDRLEAIEQGRVTPQPQIVKPVREQFQSDEAYIDAVTDYKLQQRLPEVQRQLHETSKGATSMQAFTAKEIQARKEIEDYDDAIADAADISVQASVADAILSSDVGPHLRYYLATHPDEAEALNNMSAGSAARQIGRIEARVESEISAKKTAPKKVSAAPAPIKPQKSGGDGALAIDVNDPKLSIDEFMKQRRAQRAQAHAPLKRTA